MPKKYLFILCLLFVNFTFSQKELQIIDSLKKEYNKAKKLTSKSEIAAELAQFYMAVNLLESEKWAVTSIEHAEISRDRKTMVKANTAMGNRLLQMPSLTENIKKANAYFQIAIDISKKNNLDKELSECYLNIANIHSYLSEYDKAISNITMANNIAVTIKNDSLIGICHIAFGSCYNSKGDKVIALRNYFDAKSIAEKINNEVLIRYSISSLVGFYTSIKSYDNALDNAFNNLSNSRKSTTKDFEYYIIQDLFTIGNIYSSQKKYELAKSFFEQSISKADSLNIGINKFQGYFGIFQMYLRSKQPQKALTYINSHPEMIKTYNDLGYNNYIDFAYANANIELGRLDSAAFYLKKAAPLFGDNALSEYRIQYKKSYAKFYEKIGKMDSSISQLKMALSIAEANKEFSSITQIAKLLDSANQKIGNYKEAFYYTTLYATTKDSLDKMSKEDEILQLQITDEEHRKERLLKEETEKIKKRNSIQYMVIVIAIVIVFLGLVMMGFFKVSENTIKILGFFSFIMLFEFIFLIFKKSIHQFTQGEPWKDLTAMILIAAILVPLHHLLEHKLIHYLSSQHLVILKEKGKKMFSKKPY